MHAQYRKILYSLSYTFSIDLFWEIEVSLFVRIDLLHDTHVEDTNKKGEVVHWCTHLHSQNLSFTVNMENAQSPKH